MKRTKVFILILFILILSSFAFAGFNESNNLWASLYNSTEAIALKDWSINENNLSNSGAVYSGANKAYDFDGINDKLYRSGMASDFDNDFTISMWINSNIDSDTSRVLFSLNADGTGDYLYFKIRSDKSDQLQMYMTPDSGSTYRLLYSGLSNTISDSTWYHVAVTYIDSSNTIELYINGNSVASGGTGTASAFSFTNDLTVGYGQDHFDGLISDVGTWTLVLSDSNITDIYNSGRNWNPYVYSPPPVLPDFFEISSQTYNSLNIDEFNATIDGNTYGTDNGTIITDIYQNHTSLENILVTSSNGSNILINKTYNSINLSSNYVFEYSILNISVNIEPYDTLNDSYNILNPWFSINSSDFNNYIYTNNGVLIFNTSSSNNEFFEKTDSPNLIDGINNLQVNVTSSFKVLSLTENYYNESVLIYTVEINGTNYSTTNGIIITDEVNINDVYNITVYSDNNYNVTYNTNLYNDSNLITYSLTNKLLKIRSPENTTERARCYYDGSNSLSFSTSYTYTTYLKSNLTVTCVPQENEFKTDTILLIDDNSTQTLSLSRNQFLLSFYNMNGSQEAINIMAIAYGDDNELTQFNYASTNNISYEMVDFGDGDVSMYFGRDWVAGSVEPTENGTLQYYQFENDDEIEINTDLYLLDSFDDQVYYRIKDENNKFVKDGYLYVYFLDTGNLTHPKKLIHRVRLNNLGNGITMFPIQNNLTYEITLESSGYSSQVFRFSPSEIQSSYTNPLDKILKKDSFPDNQGIEVYISPLPINPNTEQILFSIYGRGISEAYITSDYIVANSDEDYILTKSAKDGSGNVINQKAIVLDQKDIYGENYHYVQIQENEEFSVNSSNVLFDLWIVKEYDQDEETVVVGRWEEIGADYYQITGTRTYLYRAGKVNLSVSSISVYDPIDNIETGGSNIPVIFGFSVLIIFSVMASWFIKTEKSDSGKYTFLIGGIILAVIIPQLSLLGLTNGIYLAGKTIRGYYGE